MNETLVAALRTIGPDTLLSDGGTTWTADALIDAILGSDVDDSAEYVLGETTDGRTTINRLDANGYLESVPAYTEVNEVAE